MSHNQNYPLVKVRHLCNEVCQCQQCRANLGHLIYLHDLERRKILTRVSSVGQRGEIRRAAGVPTVAIMIVLAQVAALCLRPLT